VCVVNDHVLVANAISGDTLATWTSADGAIWTASSHGYACPEFGHKHAARSVQTLAYDYRVDGTIAILAVGDDLSTTELVQTGDLPAWDTLMAEPVLGTTGLVATNRAGTIWIWVPAAG
jgi:hypothetical protein